MGTLQGGNGGGGEGYGVGDPQNRGGGEMGLGTPRVGVGPPELWKGGGIWG